MAPRTRNNKRQRTDEPSAALAPDTDASTSHVKVHIAEHAEKMRAGILKLWKSNTLCDLTLRAQLDEGPDASAAEGDSDLRVHAFVMAALSEPLYTMICGPHNGTIKNGVLTLKGMAPATLKTAVDYMYTGELALSPDTTWDMIKALGYLGLEDAKLECEAFIASRTTPETVLSTLEAAREFHCPGLVQASLEYACEHFIEVAHDESWLEQTEADVGALLQLDTLRAPGEMAVLEALKRWAERGAGAERKTSFARLFCNAEVVRLPRLSVVELAVVQAWPRSLQSEDFQSRIAVEALRRHLGSEPDPSRPRQYAPSVVVPGACARTLEGHEEEVIAVVPLGDNSVISGSYDGIKVWDVASGACTRTVATASEVSSLLLHGDTLFAGLVSGRIAVYDVRTWTLARTLEAHHDEDENMDCEVFSLVMCGESLVSGSADHTIKVFDTASWTCVRTLAGHTSWVYTLVVCGGKLVSGSNDRTIRVWDPATWTCERTLDDAHAINVSCLAVHEGQLLSGSRDHSVKVWDPASWTCVRTLAAFDDSVWSLASCGDAVVVGLGIPGAIEVRDFASGDAVRTLAGHMSYINQLAWCGGKLVSASSDGTLKVWT